MISTINGHTFETTMTKIFDKEAYLAEIYIYLSEESLLSMSAVNILEIIENDYLFSYYWKM